MKPVLRIQPRDADPSRGEVNFDFVKILWTGGMIVLSLCLIPFFTNWQAMILGLSLTYVTLLFGHSIGMHRMMIHKSFKAVPWLKYFLLYIGTLVGIGGPSKVIQIHDTRDWAQRAPDYHDFFSGRPALRRLGHFCSGHFQHHWTLDYHLFLSQSRTGSLGCVFCRCASVEPEN